MIINLIDKHSAKILLFLLISPGSRYSRKEIKEKTKINNAPMDKSLIKMLNLKLLILKKRHYSLNIENAFVKQLMEETQEIKTLPLNIKFIFAEIATKIIEIKGVERLLLFGSYSKLIYSEKSDIDLALIVRDENKNLKKRAGNIAERLSRKYKKDIQLHFFTEEDLKHKEDPLIKDILKNGRDLI